jgi:hypothetical protein
MDVLLATEEGQAMHLFSRYQFHLRAPLLPEYYFLTSPFPGHISTRSCHFWVYLFLCKHVINVTLQKSLGFLGAFGASQVMKHPGSYSECQCVRRRRFTTCLAWVIPNVLNGCVESKGPGSDQPFAIPLLKSS